MIFTVSPNYASVLTCSYIKISGWSLSLTGSDIARVTLDGVDAQIFQQSKDEVTVYTRQMATGRGVPGSVVVTTSSGRVTTLNSAFTFFPPSYRDFQDFSNQQLVSSQEAMLAEKTLLPNYTAASGLTYGLSEDESRLILRKQTTHTAQVTVDLEADAVLNITQDGAPVTQQINRGGTTVINIIQR
jgi:hypothetical protein